MAASNKVNVVFVNGPIIVGAGPSGLAVAACLQQNGVPSLILERSDCIASLWHYGTYDRLKLHLPREFCQLPYLNFPEYYPKYPTKYQFVSYMESYANYFSLNPKFGQSVAEAELDPVTGFWRVRTEDSEEYFSRWLIVATGENAEPVVPQIAGLERFQGPVLHTSVYRSGSEFRNQRVLVVGCGNSGMEVSLDLSKHSATPYMLVRNSVHILPRDMFGFSTFAIAMFLLKWLPLRIVDMLLLLMASFVMGNTDRLGIRRPKTGPMELKNVTGKSPVLDVGTVSQIQAGKIKIVEGLEEITKNGARFEDGEEMEFDAIILATGYKSNVPSWLKGTDFFTEEGIPKTPFPNGWKGENGLYAVGFSRRGLLGSSADAMNIARDISEEWWMMNEIFPAKEIQIETQETVEERKQELES